PSSPDNWLGGTGNWSNVADWSAGEPGSGSDVFINTGNDNVTLDVSASINSLTLGGTTGTSTLTNSGSSTLTIAGALTINQTGTLTLNDGSATAGGTVTNAGTVNLNNDSSISGANVVNSGNINLNVGFVGATGTLTNTGSIMSADNISGVGGHTVVNSGAIVAFQVGSSADFTNHTGGIVDTGALNVGGNLTNQGTVEGLVRSSELNVSGELTNSGLFDTEYSGATVGSLNNLAGGEIHDVSGQMTVNGNASNAGGILVGSFGFGSPSGTLSIEGSLTNSGFLSVSAVSEGPASGGVSGNVVNSGSIGVSGGGGFGAGGNITNSGTITTGLQDGSQGNNRFSANGALTNTSSGVLMLNGTGDLANIGYVNNAGGISIANGASLQIVSSHSPTTALPGFLNTGTVIIAHGGTLFDALTYSQPAGQTTVDGTLQVSGHSNVLFSGGAVYGNNGDIQGNTVSNAAFNIGDGPMTIGLMAINGNYTQGPNGALYVDIASLTQFDQLNISGHASFAGTLYVDLLNGYVPQIGNMFDVVNYSSGSGTFSMVIGLPINNQEHFVLEYNSTNLTLDVVSGPDNQSPTGQGGVYWEPYVSEITGGADQLDNFSSPGATAPEPGSLILLASGLLGIAGVRRKRIR
ncbi:MAG TPA: PEP-CTERM sorting domain-containing protein, partial [Terriglobales bacterium]|nr:PEP-CTERM sorting domain-containing protein [Terriglobales bacterium]